MSQLPDVCKLPDAERQQMLYKFLAVLNVHPDLLHFRLLAPGQAERQLALFAALERGALRGNSAACPPNFDDSLDLLLCDILDVIDGHAELKEHGSAYGPQRYTANLLALGVWNPAAIPTMSAAGELFTTWFSAVTADAASSSPSPPGIYSPDAQVSGSGGDLIEASGTVVLGELEAAAASEPEASSSLAADKAALATSLVSAQELGIIHHQAAGSGEILQGGTGVSPVLFDSDACARPSEDTGDTPVPPIPIPIRQVRRGRPPVIDDLAKGRLLGLISYGLSLRQAAAQLGIHHTAILKLMQRDEVFAQQVSEARLDAISQPLLTVVHASRKNWRAAAWLAKFLEDRRVRSLEKTPEERMLEEMKRA